MRKIITSDVFKASRIIREAKVKDAISEIFKSAQATKIKIEAEDSEEVKAEKKALLADAQEAAGFEAIMTVFEACSTEKLENMLYELLAGICEKKTEDIANQTLEVTMEELKIIAKENNLANFFKSASRLTQ